MSEAGAKTPTDFIKSHAREAVKSKSLYDGSGRLQYFYLAIQSAADGDDCMLTTYTYVGFTNKVDAMKESIGQWQAIWDI